MHGIRDTGKEDRRAVGRDPRSWPGFLRLVQVFVLLLPGLAGCASDGAGKPDLDDPLTGGRAPRPAMPAAAPAVQAPTGAAVPPLPVATSADSLASLPGGGPLPGGRQLAITEPRSGRVKNTWKGPGTREENAAGGAILKKPEPVTSPAAGETVVPVNLQRPFAESTNSGAGEANHDQLLAQLKARGMREYWEQNYRDGYKFTCTIPRPNSNKIRQLEAIGGTPAEAVKAVLEKMDREAGGQ